MQIQSVAARQTFRRFFKYFINQKSQNLFRKIKKNGNVPKHLGVILDGNRHYAKSLKIPLKMGWILGQKRVQKLIDWCLKTEIKVLTVWAFSNENFNREKSQVDDLMEVFSFSCDQVLADKKLVKNGVKIKIIGNLSRLDPKLVEKFKQIEEKTKNGTNLILNVAIGYSGRDEIVEACQKIVKNGENIDENTISQNLYTANLPDPDFIIRTSGEIRTSGFLLWQASYAEFYFSPLFWPEFSFIDFLTAISNYQKRQRRFGK